MPPAKGPMASIFWVVRICVSSSAFSCSSRLRVGDVGGDLHSDISAAGPLDGLIPALVPLVVHRVLKLPDMDPGRPSGPSSNRSLMRSARPLTTPPKLTSPSETQLEIWYHNQPDGRDKKRSGAEATLREGKLRLDTASRLCYYDAQIRFPREEQTTRGRHPR